MGRRHVRALALACALLAATAPLAACTWDPQAPLRSSSSGAGAGSGEPSTDPSASSVSNHVTPSADPSPSSPAPTSSTPGREDDDDLGPVTPSPEDASGAVDPFDPTLPRATGAGTGDEVGTLADLRLTSEDDLDRVVLELEGPDVPAWEVDYVDLAVGDPSGEPVTVAGRATLQVLLHPVAYPEDGVEPYEGPSRVTRAGTRAVAEVVVSSIFEGELQVFVGVENWRRPFRVYGMTDPARIVIEVQRP